MTFPANSSFHVDATTNMGSIDSDFSDVRVWDHDFSGSEAHGDVGNGSSVSVMLKINTGSIDLHEGQ